MIAETRFAKSYNSAWRSLTPTLELFVRKANLRLTDRDWAPLVSEAPAGRRALINRVAFEAVRLGSTLPMTKTSRESAISDSSHLQSCELGLIGCSSLAPAELNEAGQLARRMFRSLFVNQPAPVHHAPSFPGCGLINSCFGDAISEAGRLIELKDGDRPFRAYEFRQLVIYAALHLNAGRGVVSELQVINSRRGLSVLISVDQFAREAAGQSPFDLLSEVIRAISEYNVAQL